jgi:CRP-like cAMP-binding protein
MHMTVFPPELMRFLHLEEDAVYTVPGGTPDAPRFEIHSRNFRAGSVIVHEGSESRLFRFVKTGWVLGETLLPDGARQIVDIYMKNEMLELPAVDGLSRVTLHAIADSSVLEFSLTSTLDLMGGQPELAGYFSHAMSRLRNIHLEHIVSLGRRTALARTGHFLLELAERCVPGWSGSELVFDCPLTQADFADVLGITPIHMNRIFRKLRMLGFATVHKGKIAISDRAHLTEIAGFSPNYLRSGTEGVF